MKAGKLPDISKVGEYRFRARCAFPETGELLVVYTPLYGEGDFGTAPLSMFEELRGTTDGSGRGLSTSGQI